MAAYPSHGILLSSVIEPESGVIDDFTPSGTQHSRIMYASQYYRWTLVHQLTLTQYNALMATYAAGQRAEYTLTYHAESPAVTYTVKFTNPPTISTNLGRGLFYVTVNLRGKKD